jgi:hypothetical protein
MLVSGRIASYRVEGARRIDPRDVTGTLPTDARKGHMSKEFREGPVRRVSPSGAAVWVARVTGPDGRRFAYKPDWNRGKGTFAKRADAQHAIDEYYDLRDQRPRSPETVGAYAATWTKRHPRARRTNTTNDGRVRQVLDVDP